MNSGAPQRNFIVKQALEVVQVFRECQNLMPALTTSMMALNNISQQHDVLLSAARRMESTTTITSSSSAAAAAEYAPTMVATAPLGVLAAFPMSGVEQLLAVHHRDRDKLLKGIALSVQSWQTKTTSAQKKAAGLDGLSSMGDAAALLTALGCSSVVGVQLGVHKLLAVLVSMGAVLQEMMLALRHDLLAAVVSQSEPFAPSLTDFLRRENNNNNNGEPPCTLLEALNELLDFIPDTWDSLMSRHLVDESLMLLAT